MPARMTSFGGPSTGGGNYRGGEGLFGISISGAGTAIGDISKVTAALGSMQIAGAGVSSTFAGITKSSTDLFGGFNKVFGACHGFTTELGNLSSTAIQYAYVAKKISGTTGIVIGAAVGQVLKKLRALFQYIQQIINVWGILSKVAIGFGATLMAIGTSGFVVFGKFLNFLIERGQALTTTYMTLKMVFGSAWKEVRDESRLTAAIVGARTTDVRKALIQYKLLGVNGLQTLGKIQHKGEEVNQNLITMVNDLAIAFGRTPEETQWAFEMSMKGLHRMMRYRFGRFGEEIGRLLAQGMFEEAYKLMEKKGIAGLATKMSNLMAISSRRIKAVWWSLWKDLAGSELDVKSIMHPISKMYEKFADQLYNWFYTKKDGKRVTSDVAKMFQNTIRGVIIPLLNALQPIVERVGEVFINILTFIGKHKGFVQLVVYLGLAASAFAILTGAVLTLYGVINILFLSALSAVIALLAGVMVLLPALVLSMGTFTAGLALLGKALGNIIGFFKDAKDSGQSLAAFFEGFTAGVRGAWAEMKKFYNIGEMFNKILGDVNKGLGETKDAEEKIVGTTSALSKGVKIGYAFAKIILTIGATLLKFIQQLGDSSQKGNFLDRMIDTIKSLMVNILVLWSHIKAFAIYAGTVLSGGDTDLDIWEALKVIIDWIVHKIIEALNFGKMFLGQAISLYRIIMVIANIFKIIFGVIKLIFKVICAIIIGIVKLAILIAKGVWAGIKKSHEAFMKINKVLKEKVLGVVKKIRDVVKEIVEWFGEKLRAAIEKSMGPMKAVGDFFVNIGEKIGSGVKKVGSWVSGGVGPEAKTFTTGVEKAVSWKGWSVVGKKIAEGGKFIGQQIKDELGDEASEIKKHFAGIIKTFSYTPVLTGSEAEDIVDGLMDNASAIFKDLKNEEEKLKDINDEGFGNLDDSNKERNRLLAKIEQNTREYMWWHLFNLGRLLYGLEPRPREYAPIPLTEASAGTRPSMEVGIQVKENENERITVDLWTGMKEGGRRIGIIRGNGRIRSLIG